jgi:hypothetical protein
LKWAENQNNWKRMEDQIKAAMNSFGLTESDSDALTRTFLSDDFMRWFKENSSLHGTQIGTGGVVLTVSTILGGLIEFSRQQQVSKT